MSIEQWTKKKQRTGSNDCWTTSHSTSSASSPTSNRSTDASWSPRGSFPSSLSSKHSSSKPKPGINSVSSFEEGDLQGTIFLEKFSKQFSRPHGGVGCAGNSLNHVLKNLMETEREIGAEECINYIVEKLKEWLIGMGEFGGSLIEKTDEVRLYRRATEALAPSSHTLYHRRGGSDHVPMLLLPLLLRQRQRRESGEDDESPRGGITGCLGMSLKEIPDPIFRNLRGNTSVDELV
ncbi:hypothetical protein RHSIM_Rhsim09G0124400 [Rhododendron simsii]|uniref:Uncharacterized protein n=1 Tax=Rhododendron simsii TaxID=118357 RepID=A0A834LFB1_RHOSS|nr:hypothetical protein RHSIM_Rhsim09G0124400 [Rhododendron simsii]